MDLFEATARKLNESLIKREVLLSLISFPPLRNLENALISILFWADATKNDKIKPITQGFGINVSFVVSIKSLKGLAFARILP